VNPGRKIGMNRKKIALEVVIDDFALWRLMDHTRFMIARNREMELARFGLTPEQSHILNILSLKGGSTTINEIVEITMRQHHSISTLINRMTKQELVKKTKTPTDNRIFQVVITPKGEKVLQKATQDSITMAFSCLSEKDKKELQANLKCLLSKAYDMLGKKLRPQITGM
jgi:DNA-binding MarR family transcriptional regulator